VGVTTDLEVMHGHHAFYAVPADWQYCLLGWDANESIKCCRGIVNVIPSFRRSSVVISAFHHPSVVSPYH
jgi:hypothetical protein